MTRLSGGYYYDPILQNKNKTKKHWGLHCKGASQVTLGVKNPPANAGDIKNVGSVPGSGRSPGGGHGNTLQCTTLWTIARQAPLTMGILQARILEWVTMPSSRGSSQPRDWTRVSNVSCIVKWILYHCTTWASCKMGGSSNFIFSLYPVFLPSTYHNVN